MMPLCEMRAYFEFNANGDIARSSMQTTTLRKLVVIYRGAEMVVCRKTDA